MPQPIKLKSGRQITTLDAALGFIDKNLCNTIEPFAVEFCLMVLKSAKSTKVKADVDWAYTQFRNLMIAEGRI